MKKISSATIYLLVIFLINNALAQTRLDSEKLITRIPTETVISENQSERSQSNGDDYKSSIDIKIVREFIKNFKNAENVTGVKYMLVILPN